MKLFILCHEVVGSAMESKSLLILPGLEQNPLCHSRTFSKNITMGERESNIIFYRFT